MHTILYPQHIALGAKIVDFAGYSMPLYYDSIVKEHLKVRHHVGVFDVSHMGCIELQGERAEEFVEFLVTNEVASKPPRKTLYALMLNSEGGVIDDLLVYKFSQDHFWLVVNAGCKQKDLTHVQERAALFSVRVTPLFEHRGILALQGPKSTQILGDLFPLLKPLKRFEFVPYEGYVISRTGYTGEEGYEFYAEDPLIKKLWEALMQRDVSPIGLGARDTLRLEMGYALYGHELSESIAPIESVAHWAVKGSHSFYGKEALAQLAQKPHRVQVPLILKERAVPREGYKVFHQGKERGVLTSGTFSPSLEKPIAIAMLNSPLQAGEEVSISIRDKLFEAHVTTLPFYRPKET